MNFIPMHERPPENEKPSKHEQSIKPDQPPKYVPKYLKAVAIQDSLPLGSEDVIISEELEETEEEAWSKATPRYDELFTGEETIETKELSPELLKAGKTEPEPEKEKPEPEDSTNSHESEDEFHDFIKLQNLM